MKKILFPVLAVIAFAASGVQAGQRAVVEPFYAFLSNPTSKAHAEAARAVMAEGWVSIGDYSGATKSADKFVGQIGGFGVFSMMRAGWFAEPLRAGVGDGRFGQSGPEGG